MKYKVKTNFDRQSDRHFIKNFLVLISLIFSETTHLICFRFEGAKKNNIFPHFCFSTHLILSKNSFVVFLRVYHRVFSRNVLHENRAKIAQRFAYVSSKICTQFRCFCAKAISRKFCRKSWYLRISLFPAFSLFR